MRALVIALMMVLLPLRGWVGDAMAQAAATPLLQAAAHADSQHDCALHPGGTEMAQDDASHQDDGCSLCQACHTLALEASATIQILLDPARIVARLVTPRFASAERALSVKPPIA